VGHFQCGPTYQEDADEGVANIIHFLLCDKYNLATMKITEMEETKMREETLINAMNDIDDIRCKLEDIHQDIMEQPDYWEKLKHQAAITAMRGMINNDKLLTFLCEENMEATISDTITSYALVIATKLVNKLKEGSQCEK
jgi:hypothetical protein